MKPVHVLVFLISATLGLHYATGYLVGGWTEQNPWGNVKYLELAKFAIKQEQKKIKLSGRYAALWLIKVQTQVVSGINYKIRFKIARRPCIKGGFSDSLQTCQHAKYYTVENCYATIYDQPWTKTRKVTSFRCK
ncbi:hypothetical protein V5799_011938 [Amblyomma americanum]|uniref:Putative tick cistatins 1 n=1 Tax=Amblyomma americanum TaxID=6943 RepID=A0A0C9SEX9_AMBAM